MKISVLARPVEVSKFTFNGETKESRKQWCVVEVDGIPTAFQTFLRDDDEPYKPGEYDLAPGAFGVVNGGLTLNKYLKLVPVRKAA
jgi:hypothetical protein